MISNSFSLTSSKDEGMRLHTNIQFSMLGKQVKHNLYYIEYSLTQFHIRASYNDNNFLLHYVMQYKFPSFVLLYLYHKLSRRLTQNSNYFSYRKDVK